jgi:integrase
VDPRYAKRGREREVPLCDDAVAILRLVRPPKPKEADPVWLGPEGKPLRNCRSVYAAKVRKVCPPPRPGWRYPDLHSLRRTCATALEQVSSLAVTAKVFGHSPGGVTGLYVQPSFDDCLAALNRAAILIHGDPEPANVVPLKRKATAS